MYSFRIHKDNVVPYPYPLDMRYWCTGEIPLKEGHYYEIMTEMSSVDEVLYHWPQAIDIVLLSETEVKSRVFYPKELPTDEHEIGLRISFRYPKDRVVEPMTNYPNWRRRGGIEYDMWVMVVESLTAFRREYPDAWDIHVIARNMILKEKAA